MPRQKSRGSMSISPFVIIISSAFLLAGLGALLVLRSHKKAYQKRGLRRYFAEKMYDIPLPRMLQALGIGETTFLYRESVDNIGECIKNCETCETTDQCKQSLKIPELNPEDVEFCANMKYLSKFSRSQRIKG
ncbi:MAG: DUF6455 family protein [Gammaproteobacteria bacterium]|nr:DUF6455 family protein [Gammaproteobacteria bacterium]